MQDQIKNLQDLGIPTATLNSDLTIKQRNTVFEQIKSGSLKLLYAAPETLLNESVINLLRDHSTVPLIAIDECHVVSIWGNSFRPTYRKLGMLKTLFPSATIAAYTATLNDVGIQDVKETLCIKNCQEFIHNLDRPSISYNIFPKVNVYNQVLSIVKKYGNTQCGIIYCQSRKKTEELTHFLQCKGYEAEAYHAGLKKDEKESVFKRYLAGDLNLVIATIAFGMGIDRSDVRYVIHVDAPANIENYMQETGRASRDGKPSDAYLLYSDEEIRIHEWMINKSITDKEVRKILIKKTRSFQEFCKSKTCRRTNMLRFFKQRPRSCGSCDVCLDFHTVSDKLIYVKIPSELKADESN